MTAVRQIQRLGYNPRDVRHIAFWVVLLAMRGALQCGGWAPIRLGPGMA